MKKLSGMLKTSENKKFTVPGVDFSIETKLTSISGSENVFSSFKPQQ